MSVQTFMRRQFVRCFGERLTRDFLFEARVLVSHLQGQIRPAQRALLRQLSKRTDLKLHLGSGPNRLPGWINVDIWPGADLTLDLRRGLPLPDNSVRYIFTEHFVEHLDYYLEVPKFLCECCRVLVKGGVLRVIVPDASLFVRAYLDRDIGWFNFIEPEHHFQTVGEGLAFNFLYAGQHHSGWDEETMAMRLRDAGFTKVERTVYGHSPISELVIERDSPIRAAHSLCFNATK